MRFMSVFRKNVREQSRDLLSLSLTLSFAPLMVLMYALFFPSGSTTYKVALLNLDAPVQRGDGSRLEGGEGVIAALQAVAYANGSPMLEVKRVDDRLVAEALLRERDSQVMVIIPDDFSSQLFAAQQGRELSPAIVTFVGDLTNPYYAVAAVLAYGALEGYVQQVTGLPQPVALVEIPLGASAARTEFEIYVPGLLVFAVILLIFQASMMVAREVESGTLRRLQVTGMTAFDYLAGTSLALSLTGAASVLLAFAAAWALGFRSQGPLWLAALVSVVTSLAMVGMGLVIASFSRSVTQAFLIANFPLAICMFFSGAIFPMPRFTLFTLGGCAIGLFDILPPTHAVMALNKILTLGAGLYDVAFELTVLVVLSLLYFAAGVWLFQRAHLRA